MQLKYNNLAALIYGEFRVRHTSKKQKQIWRNRLLEAGRHRRISKWPSQKVYNFAFYCVFCGDTCAYFM